MGVQRQVTAGRIRLRSPIARAAFVPALVCLLACAAAAQISPGRLSKAHGFLDGATQCASCHALAGGYDNLKCLDCHKEISVRLSQGRGLHARLVPKNSTVAACVRCHSEHNGETFSLIRWEPSRQAFDHTKAGFALEGKHAGLACERCHSPLHIQPLERSQIAIKDLRRTFLGLSGSCTSCHEDKHRGQFGDNCTRCHNAQTWKTGSTFDHSKTQFALTGAHNRVDCQKCHRPETPGGPVKFKVVAFRTCTSCHADPHHHDFKTGCTSCHSTATWKNTKFAAFFEHSRTKYVLTGKHAELRCAQCHRGNDYSRRLRFSTCASCHSPDPHKGQFAARADKGECASCHTTENFKTAKFTVKEHNATAYPLLDKHAAVPCAKCHQPKGAATQYKVRFARCMDCHADPHQRNFAASPYFDKCEACHTLKGYKPSTFSLAKHTQTRFALAGGHVAVACDDCHKPVSGTPARVLRPFHVADVGCAACHQDPHRGQFKQIAAKAASGGAESCTACHTADNWQELTGFDHARTRFPLDGAHRAVACISCHRPPNLELTLKNVDFRAAPQQCSDCHEEVHGNQFARAGKTPQCLECHSASRWRPSTFNHNTRTTFALEGAHAGVKCSRCHDSFRTVGARRVLFYMPTPKPCASCHGARGGVQ